MKFLDDSKENGREFRGAAGSTPPRITVYVIPWPNDQIFGVLHGFPGAGTRRLRSLEFMHRFPLLTIVQPESRRAAIKSTRLQIRS